MDLNSALPRTSSVCEASVDIEQLLTDGKRIQISPQGFSMYPLFIPGRDSAILEQVPLSTLRRGDVVLYRRPGSILVLHRICRIQKNGFYLVGDNQWEIEGPLHADQIRAKLIAVRRNGKTFSVKNPLYRILTGLWLWMLPLRPLCFRVSAALKKGLHK